MGASPRRLGRPPRFSAVHEPCREYCLALVQAFRIWRARIKQRRRRDSAQCRAGLIFQLVFCLQSNPIASPSLSVFVCLVALAQ